MMLICPTSGVVVGGWLSDQLGGYKGVYMKGALRFCFIANLGSTLLAVTCGFAIDIISFTGLIGCTVFLGACQFSTLQGIILSSLNMYIHFHYYYIIILIITFIVI